MKRKRFTKEQIAFALRQADVIAHSHGLWIAGRRRSAKIEESTMMRDVTLWITGRHRSAYRGVLPMTPFARLALPNYSLFHSFLASKSASPLQNPKKQIKRSPHLDGVKSW